MNDNIKMQEGNVLKDEMGNEPKNMVVASVEDNMREKYWYGLSMHNGYQWVNPGVSGHLLEQLGLDVDQNERGFEEVKEDTIVLDKGDDS